MPTAEIPVGAGFSQRAAFGAHKISVAYLDLEAFTKCTGLSKLGTLAKACAYRD